MGMAYLLFNFRSQIKHNNRKNINDQIHCQNDTQRWFDCNCVISGVTACHQATGSTLVAREAKPRRIATVPTFVGTAARDGYRHLVVRRPLNLGTRCGVYLMTTQVYKMRLVIKLKSIIFGTNHGNWHRTTEIIEWQNIEPCNFIYIECITKSVPHLHVKNTDARL